MSGYDNYSERFLAALFLETEDTGRDFHSARSLHQKYGFSPEKPHWIRRMADDWEYVYFKDISKPLDSYDAWSFCISPDGYRKVDANFRDEDEIRDFLGQHRTADHSAAGVTPLDHVEAEIIPASDRIVRLDHNSESYREVIAQTDALSDALSKGNDVGQMTADEVAVAAAEVSSLRNELRGEAVRIPAFWDRAKSLLGWIGKEAAGAVIGSLAVAALFALAAFLGFSVAL